MEKGKKKLFATIISMLLAFILVAEGFFTPDGFKSITKAKAATSSTAVTLNVPEISPNGDTFSFPNAEIAGSKTYNVMSISVDAGYIVPSTTYPWTLTDKLANHKTATWQWNEAKTTEEVQTIIRSMKFANVASVKVDVNIGSGETILPTGSDVYITSYKMYGYTDDGVYAYKTHYYLYVPGGRSWTEAYRLAKTYKYLGMTGYMATITEVGEDLVLDNITGGSSQAWAGGIRVVYDTANDRIVPYTELDATTFPSGNTLPSTVPGSVWVWACGPEAGTYIPVEGPIDYHKDSSYTRTEYKSYDANASINSLVKTNPKMQTYSNWSIDHTRTAASSNGEPNNYNGGEWCLLVHFGQPAQHSQYGWNDYPLTNGGIVGFFTEFGGYDDDPWYDPDTGLPLGDGGEEVEEGSTSSQSVQIKTQWKVRTEGNAFIAYCEIIMTDLETHEETVLPTNSQKPMVFRAASRYYNGSPYSYSNYIDPAERSGFLEKAGLDGSAFPLNPSVTFYMDEECTIPTDNANSGAAGSGQAPVEIGQYYAKSVMGDNKTVVDAFEILPPPDAEEDPHDHYDPGEPTDETPLPILSNLRGYQKTTDYSVDIMGNWGETDPDKKLAIDLGGTYTFYVGMADVVGGKNFFVNIPADVIGNETFMYVYPQGKPEQKIKIYLALYPYCTLVGDNFADIEWPAVAGATGYIVDVAYDENFTNKVTGWSDKAIGTNNFVKITGLEPEITYYYRVRATESGTIPVAYSRPNYVKTLEEGADPEQPENPIVRRDRAPYTIGADGLLPRGLLYGEIDYDTDFIQDAVVYAKDSEGNALLNSFINLTTEHYETDFVYDYYSTNGGKTWSKAKKLIDDKKLQTLLKKGFTLKLLKGTVTKNKPAADAVIISFDKINPRQKLSTIKVNYSFYSDYSGLSNGQWTTMVNNLEVNVAKYWFGITDKTGKKLGDEGWGLWPYMDGVWLKDLEGGKQVKEKYLYKLPAFCTTPGSITKKITVYGIAKPSKSKVNYSYESFTLNKDFMIYYGEEIPDTRKDKEKLIRKTDAAPFEYIDTPLAMNCKDKTITDYLGKAFNKTGEKPVKLSLSAYLTDERNTVIIWKQATALKPASDKLVIKLARRGPEANEDTNFIVKSGTVKLKISKLLSYTILDTSNNKWKSVAPKITGNTIATVRAKCTAKGGKETNDQYAIGYESYLVLEYGVYNTKSGRKGIVGAKAFADKADAEAYLAELNAKAAVSPTPTPTTAP